MLIFLFSGLRGKAACKLICPNFVHNQQVILVHNVHTSDEDLAYCKQAGISDQLYWCLCPNANWYISGRLPAIENFIKEEQPVVLGTDSLASNHQLSIAAEMKTIQSAFPRHWLRKIIRLGHYKWSKSLANGQHIR